MHVYYIINSIVGSSYTRGNGGVEGVDTSVLVVLGVICVGFLGAVHVVLCVVPVGDYPPEEQSVWRREQHSGKSGARPLPRHTQSHPLWQEPPHGIFVLFGIILSVESA